MNVWNVRYLVASIRLVRCSAACLSLSKREKASLCQRHCPSALSYSLYEVDILIPVRQLPSRPKRPESVLPPGANRMHYTDTDVGRSRFGDGHCKEERDGKTHWSLGDGRQTSTLLILPLEIRLLIWKLAGGRHSPPKVSSQVPPGQVGCLGREVVFAVTRRKHHDRLGTLRLICKQANWEITPLFFEVNPVFIGPSGSRTRDPAMLLAPQFSQMRNHIRKITFSVGRNSDWNGRPGYGHFLGIQRFATWLELSMLHLPKLEVVEMRTHDPCTRIFSTRVPEDNGLAWNLIDPEGLWQKLAEELTGSSEDRVMWKWSWTRGWEKEDPLYEWGFGRITCARLTFYKASL